MGLYALLRREFREELEWSDGGTREETVSLACGVLAQPLLEKLLSEMKEKWPGIKVHIHGVVNRLFGDTVTVTGLLCGKDLADGLRGLPLGSRLLLPSVMLRHEEAFLDDTTVPWLEEQLGVPVQVVDMDGGASSPGPYRGRIKSLTASGAWLKTEKTEAEPCSPLVKQEPWPCSGNNFRQNSNGHPLFACLSVLLKAFFCFLSIFISINHR